MKRACATAARGCGTHLLYRLRPGNQHEPPAGLFQEQACKLGGEIFIDAKPAFYEPRNDTRKLTGQQVFEQYAPSN